MDFYKFIKELEKVGEAVDVNQVVGQSLIDQVVKEGKTTIEFDLKMEEYFTACFEKSKIDKQWLNEQQNILDSHPNPSADASFQFYADMLAYHPDRVIVDEETFKKNYNYYNMYVEEGLLIKNNKIELSHFLELENHTEILKEFDQFGYIPPKSSPKSYFSMVMRKFNEYQEKCGADVNYVRSNDTKLDDFYQELKKTLNTPEYQAKLINLGLDKEGVNIALVNSDYGTIEKFCTNNQNADIFYLADHFILKNIAAEIWESSDSNELKTMVDLIDLRLNGVKHLNFGNTQTINKTFFSPESFSPESLEALQDMYKVLGYTVEENGDVLTISSSASTNDTASLREMGNLGYTFNNPFASNPNTMALLISDRGGKAWSAETTKSAFKNISRKVGITECFGNGNEYVGSSNIVARIKMAAQEVQAKQLDTYLVKVEQHGLEYFTDEFHTSILTLPKSNVIYFFGECHAIHRINLINYHDQVENIPLHQNCLFVSDSGAEPSRGDCFAHTKFNEFFQNNVEFTMEQIARFVDWAVKTSTPHISGYYHGTAVGPCKLSEFIAELDNPASNINQNIEIENLLGGMLANISGEAINADMVM